MAKYHVNDKGEAGVCSARAGNCPFGGAEDHYESAEAAREAYSKDKSSFAVAIRREPAPDRNRKLISAEDPELAQAVARAEEEYAAAGDVQDWLVAKIEGVERVQHSVLMTHPGTPEREAALEARAEARQALLAADLVNWKHSPFYRKDVEEAMKRTAVVVQDADSSIEAALADERRQGEIAAELGLARQDVTRILELTQEDYLRPRSPQASSIRELAQDEQYATYTAHVFRIEEEQVKQVLSLAASNSSL